MRIGATISTSFLTISLPLRRLPLRLGELAPVRRVRRLEPVEVLDVVPLVVVGAEAAGGGEGGGGERGGERRVRREAQRGAVLEDRVRRRVDVEVDARRRCLLYTSDAADE